MGMNIELNQQEVEALVVGTPPPYRPASGDILRQAHLSRAIFGLLSHVRGAAWSPGSPAGRPVGRNRPKHRGGVAPGRAWTARLWHRASVRVASGGLVRVASPPATTNNAVGKYEKPFNMRRLGMIYWRPIAPDRGLFRHPDAKRPQKP
jgi:hypothetical protein